MRKIKFAYIILLIAAIAVIYSLIEKPRKEFVGGKIFAIACDDYEGSPNSFKCESGGGINVQDDKYQLICNDGKSVEVLQKFCRLITDFKK